MAKLIEWILKFKDVLTTVVGFLPLVVVIYDTINNWAVADGTNLMALVLALAVAINGWFIGKRAKPV